MIGPWLQNSIDALHTEIHTLRAQVAVLTQERDRWHGLALGAHQAHNEALAREQALREALEKIIGLTFEAAVDNNRPVSGYRIRQLADAALQPPDAPTE